MDFYSLIASFNTLWFDQFLWSYVHSCCRVSTMLQCWSSSTSQHVQTVNWFLKCMEMHLLFVLYVHVWCHGRFIYPDCCQVFWAPQTQMLSLLVLISLPHLTPFWEQSLFEVADVFIATIRMHHLLAIPSFEACWAPSLNLISLERLFITFGSIFHLNLRSTSPKK